MTLAAQFALTMFEGTVALFAQAKFAFGPTEVAYVFVVCGLVMTVFQVGVVSVLADKVSEMKQIGVGFAMMGAGIALLAIADTEPLVFAFVALLSLGMAFIAPNVSALVSKRGGEQQVRRIARPAKRSQQPRTVCGPASGRRPSALARERAIPVDRRPTHRARRSHCREGSGCPSNARERYVNSATT